MKDCFAMLVQDFKLVPAGFNQNTAPRSHIWDPVQLVVNTNFSILVNRAGKELKDIHGHFGQREQVFQIIFPQDRKSTRLNSSHVKISYAVFCLKKKNNNE